MQCIYYFAHMVEPWQILFLCKVNFGLKSDLGKHSNIENCFPNFEQICFEMPEIRISFLCDNSDRKILCVIQFSY